jgi:hypothetical protein
MLTYKNPKAKSCAVCERVFVPQSMSQIVCRQSCALKKARADRLAAEKAEGACQRAGCDLHMGIFVGVVHVLHGRTDDGHGGIELG